MISELALLPDRRAVRRFDVLAAVSALVFVTLGVIAGVELWNLSRLSTSLLQAATAIEQAGSGVALLGHLPVVGGGAGRLAQSIRDTAASVRVNAVDARSSVRVLAVVISLAVAVIPLVPLVGVYLPLRLARYREVRSLARLVRRPVEPLLVEHLARAALTRLPYAQLRRVSGTPWRDVEDGRHHRLAAAELRRLGVTPPEWLAGRQ